MRRDAGLRTTFCGTPIYLSPEVLVGEDYDEGIDIWSVGMILYEMLHKANPFGITNKQTLANILNEPVRFDPTNVPISDCARQFIELCLKKQAAERPNIRELLAHEFLARFNTEEAKR